jgi:hypothetical protein
MKPPERFGPDALLHHSDRGSQCIGEQLQRLKADHGVVCSVRRSGNCWDNVVIENPFHVNEVGADCAQNLPSERRSQGRHIRVHQALLQPETSPRNDQISEPYGVRDKRWIGLSGERSNGVQARLIDGERGCCVWQVCDSALFAWVSGIFCCHDASCTSYAGFRSAQTRVACCCLMRGWMCPPFQADRSPPNLPTS